MTKQEYESSTAIIMADKKLGHTNRMTELRYIDAEYIRSLEAENVKLEKLISTALEQLSKYACPSGRNNYGQPCNDSDDCVACWREYLGGEDE